ncbi:MAG: AAA family ATPase [Campylobacteraceae bacterium]
MSKLDFLPTVNLKEVRNIGEREVLIDGFVVKRSINLLWAPAGTGKTEFMFGVSNALVKQNQEVAYMDVDNGLDLIMDRGYDNMIEKTDDKFKYINADMFDEPREGIMGIIDKIKENAKDRVYDNCVFVFDSLKFFLDGDMYDERRINRFLSFCKAIRRCGGIVWILNHATKKGDTMKGGQGLIDAADECWQMSVLTEDNNNYSYIIEPEKYRMGNKIKKVGFSMDKKTYILTPLDVEIASMSENEKDFIEVVTNALKEKELTQGELMKLLGKDRADKTVLDMLKKHDGSFWDSKKQGKKRVYTNVTNEQTNEQTA